MFLSLDRAPVLVLAAAIGLLSVRPASAATASGVDDERLALLSRPAVVRVADGCQADIRFAPNGKVYPVLYGGLGSAFFVNSDGYLVTNAHMATNTKSPDDCKTQLLASYLVQLARDYREDPRTVTSDKAVLGRVLDNSQIRNFHVISQVILPNGTTLPFEIKSFGAPTGQDDGKDVAVLKVEVKNAPTLRLADSNGVQVLQRVIAVGYPAAADSGLLGRSASLQASFTDGKISAIKPSATGAPLLQHSAPATHGSSGGPLLNENGDVIGITAFRGDTVQGQEVQGFTFAVPSNTVLEYVRQAGTTNHDGPTDEAYRAGLQLFWSGHYQESIAKLEEMKRLFPQHSEVDRLIQAAQQAISTGVPPAGTGADASASSGPLGGVLLLLRPESPLGGGALALFALGSTAVAGFTLLRRTRRLDINRPPMPD